MHLHIEPSNGLAIYDQIARQIKFAIAGGALREGELAPGIRELARELTINPNTVARAYQQLQFDEILETARGTGMVVKKTAAARCRKERAELIQERLSSALMEAKKSGISTSDIRALLDKELKRLEKEEASA
jgi:GntR family transcriptional regulator